MSIALELNRLQTDRNTIRTKLVELGIADGVANLDKLATAIEGIANQGAVSATVQEGDTYTIPKGYHNGSGTVSGIKGGGNYTLQSKTIAPTKKQQNVTPDSGYYGLSDVTVGAIPANFQDVTSVNVSPNEVLTGKIYVTSAGVVTTGTMPNNGAVDRTLSATAISYTIPKGFHDGKGTIKIVLEEKVIVPTKEEQIIIPISGKVLSKVTVSPIPAEYITTTDATATAEQILVDETAYVGGEKVTGIMPNNGAVKQTMDGLTSTSVAIPAGYTTGGTVTLTGDIEEQLSAI